MRKACGVEVLLFEIAHCLWICSSFYSNFEKQNRKGSPQSLIYPYKGKLTSFMIKQFFRFSKVHQTLSRSRLRRFLPLSFASTAKTSTHASRSLRMTVGVDFVVTLSKRGIEPLRLCNTVYLRARRTSVSGVNPNGRQKMPRIF